MTAKKAARITGLDIRRLHLSDVTTLLQDYLMYGAFKGESLVATAYGTTHGRALAALVATVYRIRSDEVIRRQEFKCADCGALAPLSVHHETFRSHGRSDRTENLMALCERCHQMRHGIRG